MDSFKDIDMLEPEPEPAPLKWPKRQEFHTLIFFFFCLTLRIIVMMLHQRVSVLTNFLKIVDCHLFSLL